MSFLFASRNTLSLITLVAAGTLLSPELQAGPDEREQISVQNESELRAALSELFQPAGTTDEGEKQYHNNADVSLSGSFSVVTTRETEIEDDEGHVTGTETLADNAISILANNVKLSGEGNSLSSSAIDVSVKGAGDLFFLHGVKFSVENITFAGTLDETKKTGRVFITGNSGYSSLDIGAGTIFENRRLVTDDVTHYRAQGGVIVSAHILDEISLTTSSAGDISFNGNLAYGKTIAPTVAGEAETVFDAAGGAVFTSGLFSVSGTGATSFSKNSAISDGGTAFGGAIFVTNANLNADGTLNSSIVYPDNVTDNTGTKNFGLRVSETTLSFSENSARGANAQGGAVTVSGGYFDAVASQIEFKSNSIKNTAVGGKIFGGAVLLSESAKATFDNQTTLSFTDNSVEAGAEQTTASGGALAVSDSALELAGAAVFTSNRITSSFGGSALSGGAVYVSGTMNDVTASDGTTKKEPTTRVSLNGTLNFEQNRIYSTALASEKITEEGGIQKTEIIESSAQGGAFAVSGGKIDGANLVKISFNKNCAEAKTLAQGGAIASLSDKTELTFNTNEAISFSLNEAKILALNPGENQTAGVVPVAQGGAVFVDSGLLEFVSETASVEFTQNRVDASEQAGAFAQGGAISQREGALLLGASLFSENSASADLVRGGAIYVSGGNQKFAGATKFTGNTAMAGTAASAAGTTFARGGAIFIEASSVADFSEKAEFDSNKATANSELTASAGGMRSGAAGGAIYSAGTLTYGELIITNNRATVTGDPNGSAFGGSVYVAGGKISVASVQASSSRVLAGGDALGGAIYVDAAALFDTSGSFAVSGNAAGDGASGSTKASGGAVFAAGTLRVGGTFTARQNSAEGKAASGGAVAVEFGTFSVAGNVAHEISTNSATASAGNAHGGAISVNGGSFLQTAGTLNLSGNTASAVAGNALGGAVFLRGGEIELFGATISNNSASGATAFGGAIYIDSSLAGSLKLSGNTTLSGNTSNGTNDGIYIGAGTGEVQIILNTDAELTTHDDGSVTRDNVEVATISDKLTADAATLVFTKIGAGNLELGEVSAINDAKISMHFNGGVSILKGDISALETLSVASGAEVTLQGMLGGYTSAEIAGTVNVGSGAVWTFASASETKLTGALAFDGATAKVSGAVKFTGNGNFSVRNATVFDFDAGATMVAQMLSVGTGTLTLNGAGTLNITEKLIFSEVGNAEIVLNGTTLGIVDVERTAKGDVVAKISGTNGKLVIYREAGSENPPDNVDFSAFFEKVKDETAGEETTTLYKGTFEIGGGVSVEAGLVLGDGVALKLSSGTQVSGSKNILLNGGTLTTDAGSTLALESLIVSGDNASSLGVAGENQIFRMVESATGETDGNGNPITEIKALSLTGELEITETTKFIGDIFLGNSGAIAGAGTVEGDVSGKGTVSVSQILGNISVKNGNVMTVSGNVVVSGNVELYPERASGTTANAVLRLVRGASLSAQKFNNFGTVSAESATLSGNFVNAGTLSVAKDSTLVFAAGSTFSNGFSDGTETLAGTLDLSAANSAIDFSAIVDESNIVLDNGVIRIDATHLQKGEALPILGIENEAIFENLKIEDVNRYGLSDRFVWDATSGEFVFLGLNGERFRGTLYGDLQRESLNATYDFMRSAQFRGRTRTLTPELYGAYKLQSPYMRGYIEKVRQRGGEVSAKLEAKRKAELAMAEKLNSRLMNFWAQADFSDGHQRSRKGFDAYDTTRYGALVGASMPFENWELGLAISGSDSNYDMHASTRHEIDTTAYGLTGYAQYRDGWFDCTLGLAGMMTSSESDRGEYTGEFDGWRAGAMAELGATLNAQSWFALRTYVGLAAAYSYADAFRESGGAGALSIDSDGAASVRASVGVSAAFLLCDTLQLKVHTAWLNDFGNDTCSLDAYMPGTHTDYVIDSRKNESSALEAGASLNWTFSECTEVFFGYTGTIRAGERIHGASLGLNYFF